MSYLSKYGYSEEEIKELEKNISAALKDTLVKSSSLVCENLDYLKSLGVTNIKEIFSNYYEMFLMDTTSFMNVFNKYETDDLISKLEKNVAIIEYL